MTNLAVMCSSYFPKSAFGLNYKHGHVSIRKGVDLFIYMCYCCTQQQTQEHQEKTTRAWLAEAKTLCRLYEKLYPTPSIFV